MNNQKKVSLFFWITTALFIGYILIGLFFVFHPEWNIHLEIGQKQCAFPCLFHLYCPGCGGTRAVNSLLRFSYIRSALEHPFPLYLFLLFIQTWIQSVYSYVIRRDGRFRVKIYAWQMWLMLALVIGFFVIRNILLIIWRVDYLGDVTYYMNVS